LLLLLASIWSLSESKPSISTGVLNHPLMEELAILGWSTIAMVVNSFRRRSLAEI
jgi:hypothetical protein